MRQIANLLASHSQLLKLCCKLLLRDTVFQPQFLSQDSSESRAFRRRKRPWSSWIGIALRGWFLLCKRQNSQIRMSTLLSFIFIYTQSLFHCVLSPLSLIPRGQAPSGHIVLQTRLWYDRPDTPPALVAWVGGEGGGRSRGVGIKCLLGQLERGDLAK